MSKTKVMPIKDVDAALRAYYGNGYVSNKQISEIFGTKATSTIANLKRPVRAAEKEQNIPVAVLNCINARIAFQVWGIDVKELEKNRQKARDLGL